MAKNYLTPGVYVEEISNASGIVAEVQSAVPAFIGYTEKTRYDGRSLLGVPEPVASYTDFATRFGGAAKLSLKAVNIRTDSAQRFSQVESVQLAKRFLLHEAVRMYFANGGGACYVVSVGSYADNASKAYDKEAFEAAIETLEAVDDVTLLVMPEAVLLGESFYSVQQAALKHCAKRQNRFAILDIKEETGQGSILLNWQNQPDYDKWRESYKEFRDRVGIDNLSYGAAYTPYVVADVPVRISYAELRDYLFGVPAKAGETPPRLALEVLDPEAKAGILNLNLALKDQASIEAAVALARKELDPNAASIGEALKKKLAVYSAENMQALALVCAQLFARLLGTAPAGEGGGEDYTLSPDMARHALDQLGRILDGIKKDLDPAYKPGEKPEPQALLTDLQDSLAKVPEEGVEAVLRRFVDLLGNELYQASRKNVERLSDGLSANSAVYPSIVSAVQTALRVQPPSAMMAGIYANVDRARGVWKAPANVSAAGVLRLTQTITAEAQEVLNSDSVAGKSINALRSFPGKGFLVWGARTLDGNSQEWRYIPVRRFFIMVEESIRRATTWAVFEPNDASLWTKVKALIDNYLLQKWKDGALMGAAPTEAYFVNVGLGSTMTEQDILEGRLIIEIGMAVVRPAEFIILRFSHKMQQG